MDKQASRLASKSSQRNTIPQRTPTPIPKLNVGLLAKSLLKALPRGTFAAAGGAMAGPPGAAAGAVLARVTGYGDYTVTNNSLHKNGSVVSGGVVPQFANKGPTGTRITHREFIGNVVVPPTPSSFSSTNYLMQPGDPSTFPWFNALATNYQAWKLHGAVYSFKSLASEYSSTSALGKVVLSTNYNVLEEPYANMVQAENAEFAVATKPSESMLHPIECASSQRRNDPFYVRDPNKVQSTSNNDPRFYDMCRTQLITEGLTAPAGSILGELWLTYDIELLKPVISGLNSVDPVVGTYTHTNATTSNYYSTPYTLVGDVSGLLVTNGNAVSPSFSGVRVTIPSSPSTMAVVIGVSLDGSAFTAQSYTEVDPAAMVDKLPFYAYTDSRGVTYVRFTTVPGSAASIDFGMVGSTTGNSAVDVTAIVL